MSDEPAARSGPSASDLRSLRSRGRTISASFVVGKGGLTEGGVRKVDELLDASDLVKVRVLPASPLSVEEAADRLANAARATVVQMIGSTILLFRAPSENRD